MKKNLILLFCLAALSLFACETPDTPITKEQLPQIAQSFINLYFNDVQIAYIQKDNDSYDVKFSNGFEVDFNKKGEWKEVDCQASEVPAGIIPENIRNYVNANYNGFFIVQIGKDHSEYDVELNNGLELVFDKNGNFKRIDD